MEINNPISFPLAIKFSANIYIKSERTVVSKVNENGIRVKHKTPEIINTAYHISSYQLNTWNNFFINQNRPLIAVASLGVFTPLVGLS